jgi:hypothetical protein
LLYKVFRENKKLNLELENSFSKIASLRSVHDDMSAKPCDNCTMIMVNYFDLWLMHSQFLSQLKGAKLDLRELKARSSLLGACTNCPLLRSDLEASAIEIKNLKHKLENPSRYNVLSPPCELCGSLKGKLFHATKENTELKQKVAYLTSWLKRTVVSEKLIEDDLSRVEESVTKSTYKLGIGFERCEDKGENSDPKFISSSNYRKEEEAIKLTKTHYPSNPKPSFNPKREVKRESPSQERKLLLACFMIVLVTWMSFASVKRGLRSGILSMLETHIVMSSLSFRLVLTLVLRLALLLVLCLTSLMDLTIAHIVLVHERATLCLDALDMAHILIMVIVSCVDLFFSAGASHTHFEHRHLDGPHFPRRGSHPTGSSGEVLKTMNTSSGRMVKCWIPKIYLTNPSTESLTFSHPM